MTDHNSVEARPPKRSEHILRHWLLLGDDENTLAVFKWKSGAWEPLEVYLEGLTPAAVHALGWRYFAPCRRPAVRLDM